MRYSVLLQINVKYTISCHISLKQLSVEYVSFQMRTFALSAWLLSEY